MKWIYRLESRFKKFTIKNIMFYIVAITGFVFIASIVNPLIIDYLILNPELVFKGQVWRLITFLFIPPSSSVLFLFIILYFYYWIGLNLEHHWGSFKFNLYYLIGVLATIIGSMITNIDATGNYINTSMFLAFAYLFPDVEILMFFFFPVKVKYLGYLEWAYIIYTVLFLPFPLKALSILSVVNFLVFFGRDLILNTNLRRKSFSRRRKFQKNFNSTKNYRHRCTVCGITEADDPKMEFRYCSKCAGRHAYCSEHIFNHEHITEEEELNSKVIEFKPRKDKKNKSHE
ncbi:hypothetical protein ABG79_01788 [Caloramator mitchellensis]|uniref:Uncharacterized protein n=1 Tax=Caloramator mitchellensis TaxID=908809 RepID=A0A0R3JSC4_CALMK|nr:rhomboid family intramembrane serine protease [Caloramator mitchellensis]KRQ86407.1 hypothetical protein ABG79_01788 [Caloramator mitchellensis]